MVLRHPNSRPVRCPFGPSTVCRWELARAWATAEFVDAATPRHAAHAARAVVHQPHSPPHPPPSPLPASLKAQRLCGRCRGASPPPRATAKCPCGTCGTPPPLAPANPPAPAAPRQCGPARPQFVPTRPQFAPARRRASAEPPCSEQSRCPRPSAPKTRAPKVRAPKVRAPSAQKTLSVQMHRRPRRASKADPRTQRTRTEKRRRQRMKSRVDVALHSVSPPCARQGATCGPVTQRQPSPHHGGGRLVRRPIGCAPARRQCSTQSLAAPYTGGWPQAWSESQVRLAQCPAVARPSQTRGPPQTRLAPW